jgi:hypothetical protein
MVKPVYYFRTKDGYILQTQNPEFFKNETEITPKAEGKRLIIEQTISELKKRIQPGSTVYTCLRSVSASGMTRNISLHIVEDGQIRCIDYPAHIIMGEALAKRQGLIVKGCGMDMGFHLVYTLGRYLYPEGTEGRADGGYSLEHRWL